jgi:hypothetical protein
MTSPSIKDKYAIVIGVASYEDEGIQNLRYTTNDAIRLAKVLSERSAYDKKRIYLLADAEKVPLEVNVRKPTRSNIFDVIAYITKTASDKSEILFFFAGHGAEISKEPYLLTSDTKLNIVSKTAIDIREINSLLQESKAQCILKIFDACRSGFSDGRAILGRMTDGLQDAITYQATGWATISSCSSGEVAYESSEFEHGVFSNYLCEALEGNAALNDGLVTFERAVDYVKIGVRAWCDRQTVQQTPHLVSDLSGTLVLSTIEIEKTVAPLTTENPLSILLSRLDTHLAQVPVDVRNLAFTNNDQLMEFSKGVMSAVEELTAGLSHKAINISVQAESYEILNAKRGPIRDNFILDLDSLKVKEELKGAKVVRCSFSSSEVIIPTTDLYIAMVRFSFFYWIWWFHLCNPKQLENKFTPDPPFRKGLSTFKPTAITKQERLSTAVNEVFEQVSLSILRWSEQLQQFVDARIDPLRKLGDVID